ncbi:MAG: fatty acid desaturase [Candidatus Omnitrophota bacterium]|nr:fatty acid desaturase [Candidatus Omnitrophota bacterium]MDZ4243221.1 fatty acid desaturase [Candidatus Omnitrophota bacterium]
MSDQIANIGKTMPVPGPLPWQKIVARYQKPRLARSVWQLVNTLVPYAVLWVLMYHSLSVSYWITLALAVFAAGLMVRIFIIFHDCGHGAFFNSLRANNLWGFITGVLTFTPYDFWRHEHAQHHAAAGNLDKRGFGDVWTMTVKEYLKASRWTRIKYRFVRNPVCLFLIGPAILFLVIHRIPWTYGGERGRRGTHLTNLGILAVGMAMSLWIGWEAYLLIQIPTLVMAASAGVWLFYVQHQFEGVYWERQKDWDYVTEALKGSSFYKLPRVLQWFTGSIGFHHIHHLCPKIPNYFLEKCYNENPLFQEIKPITFFSSFKSLTFRLWDEQCNRLVGFGYLKTLKQQGAC